ncbi:MAG TPA: hypothetical protein VGE97_03495 [Nitrososphaera sp.]|jgi:hypothetical protein
MEWRDVRIWLETENVKHQPLLSFEAGELIRKWGNIKSFKIPLGTYYDDGIPRVQDINGLHKLDIINKNIQDRKSFVGKGATSTQSAPSHKPVRSATGKARRR